MLYHMFCERSNAILVCCSWDSGGSQESSLPAVVAPTDEQDLCQYLQSDYD